MAIELTADDFEKIISRKIAGRSSVAKGQRYMDLQRRRRQLDEETRSLRLKLSEQAGRASEDDIALGVLKFLNSVKGQRASIGEIKDGLPAFVDLAPADQAISESRPHEAVWEQQIRNIVSHRDIDGNFIQKGLLDYPKRGVLELTNEGKKFVCGLKS